MESVAYVLLYLVAGDSTSTSCGDYGAAASVNRLDLKLENSEGVRRDRQIRKLWVSVFRRLVSGC